MSWKLVVPVTLVAAVATAALAADDVIGERRAIMRTNLRTESKANQLIMGKYNAERAAEAMRKMADGMATFATLFPEGSETGGETKAGPDIWTDRENFEAQIAAFVETVKAAEAAAANGQDAFTLAWQPVVESCPACHAVYAPAADFR
jgi:cytochrome c556